MDPTPLSEVFDELAVVGKAFGSARRLELIDLLTQGERTVDALSRQTGMGVSTTSAHLQILKLSNLVRTRREGTRIHYRLAGEDVAALYAAMRQVALANSPDVEKALAAHLGMGEVEEVSHPELLRRLQAGDVLLVDVRPAEEYAAGHIPGAVSIPFGSLQEALGGWPPGEEIITYCRGAYCVMASDAVRLLTDRGRTARRLKDGLLEWRLAGHPVERTPV
ncbi:ArsR/SmtB family transcription factor [Ornithinimicrobium sediminis]|uniref:ArsR/SmtB family transcription factor n=1 Tax=Ornithinimicrobium sediminis TaxID=2904603 RepID=UPI001E2CF59D|nr:metalloregulator ArsR/SmtB family transcription factor [Ornithinimicrobium sediminis]